MASHAEPEVDEDVHDGSSTIDPQALVRDVAERIVDETRRHPLRTLGIAFGAGYVLGGGLPRFAVRMAVAAGLRTAGAAILSSDLAAELAQRALGNLRGPPREEAPPPKNGRARRRRNGT